MLHYDEVNDKFVHDAELNSDPRSGFLLGLGAFCASLVCLALFFTVHKILWAAAAGFFLVVASFCFICTYREFSGLVGDARSLFSGSMPGTPDEL